MRPWQDQAEVVTVASGLARPDFPSAGSIYLIRPDGYVAARGSAANPDTLLDYLHRLFGTTGDGSARASAPTADANT